MELTFDLGYGEKGNWRLAVLSFKSSFMVI